MAYVAYVGSYTHENSVGIHIYDVDVETGIFTQKGIEQINNPSYLTISKDGRYLYSIEDEGVAAFKIGEEGELEFINNKGIGGMRGCYLCVDSKNRYLFIGGYHDGRVTMMKLNEDGSIGDVSDGIFHQGMSNSSIEQRLEPKVTCVELSPSENYLYAVDYGIDQIKIYHINYELGKLELVDIIRCPFGGAPRIIRFSSDGKYIYLLSEKRNKIVVYSVEENNKGVLFEQIQTVSIIGDVYMTAAAADIELSDDEEYMYASVDGINGMACLKRDKETGMLELQFETRVSGNYPKVLCVLPGRKFVVSLNHDTDEIRSFEVNYNEKYCLMRTAPIKVKKPNCIKLLEI